MAKRTKIITAVVLALSIILLLYLALQHYLFAEQASEEMYTVTRGDITESVDIAGQIIPNHVVQVKSQLSGQVSQLMAEPGDMVHKGQELAVILPTPTPENIAKAQAELSQAQASFDNAAQQYQRYQTLLKHQAIEADKAQSIARDYHIAKAKLDLAKQTLALITQGKTDIQGQQIQNIIVSPIDGKILSRTVEVGDSVVPVTPYQAGTPVFIIANMQHLIFRGNVTQLDVNQLHAGQKAKIDIAALPNVSLKGKIERIAPLISQAQSQAAKNTGSEIFSDNSDLPNGFSVQIGGFSFPEDITSRAGFQATATVVTRALKNVIILPQRAVSFDDKGSHVLLWQGRDTSSKKQYVTLGASDWNNVEVTSGLKPGQKVLFPQDTQ